MYFRLLWKHQALIIQCHERFSNTLQTFGSKAFSTPSCHFFPIHNLWSCGMMESCDKLTRYLNRSHNFVDISLRISSRNDVANLTYHFVVFFGFDGHREIWSCGMMESCDKLIRYLNRSHNCVDISPRTSSSNDVANLAYHIMWSSLALMVIEKFDLPPQFQPRNSLELFFSFSFCQG